MTLLVRRELHGNFAAMNKAAAGLNQPARIGLAAALGAAGLAIIAAYFGAFNHPPASECLAIFCDPYHWQILAIGIAFSSGSASLLIPEGWPATERFNATLLLLSFLAGFAGSFLAMLTN